MASVMETKPSLSLIATLITSLYVINDENASPWGQTLLFKGQCKTVSRISLWAHLGINIVATGVLASSNFFMQALVAPTRSEVDKVHASGKWLEIGVPSIGNIRRISRWSVLLWFLFSMSSVPLHLIFNGCILESKASNGFTLVMVSESFLDGAPHKMPYVTSPFVRQISDDEWLNTTILDIYRSVSQDSTQAWEKIHFDECMHRYNNTDQPLTKYRHVIMVITNGTSTTGWTRRQVMNNVTLTEMFSGWNGSDDRDVVNSLWWSQKYYRSGTRNGNGYLDYTKISDALPSTNDAKDMMPNLNPVSGEIVMRDYFYRPAYQDMQVQYCLSERFQAPCRLTVSNPLLLVVCIMCIFKTLLCILVLVVGLRLQKDDSSPLITPGDAIASFIVRPDLETKGMCTLNRSDLTEIRMHAQPALINSSPKIRQWHLSAKRRLSAGVPRHIWVLGASRFSHDPINKALTIHGLEINSFLGKTMLANTPQLILSICYMVYNGLFTRMLAEVEWSKYSINYRSLRVTSPQGQQRSTYRLQLPYRWSIPLILVSVLLHWTYSNCIYVSNYLIYNPEYPFDVEESTETLQYSTLAILVALISSIAVALSPLLLAFIRLPGKLTIGASNSAVISAACHCVSQPPISAAPNKIEVSVQAMEDEDENLQALASQPLKWGDISTVSEGESGIGHLAFGTKDQCIEEPVEGKLYS
ncbi:Ff.00g080070.m01.CDS01 [Fusarium sp. VM40]|nr:Ff.00g080070.m01.CDS01 [Fusarium sp. VM40]